MIDAALREGRRQRQAEDGRAARAVWALVIVWLLTLYGAFLVGTQMNTP